MDVYLVTVKTANQKLSRESESKPKLKAKTKERSNR